MRDLRYNYVEPNYRYREQAEFTALWSPRWYDTDQDIVVGEGRDYRFFQFIPTYILLNLIHFKLPCPQLVFKQGLYDWQEAVLLLSCEIIEIRNNYWGAVKSIKNDGLHFDMTLESGKVITVNTEEEPGAIWDAEHKAWMNDTRESYLPEGSNEYELCFDWNMYAKIRILNRDPKKLFTNNWAPKPCCKTEHDYRNSTQHFLDAAQAGELETIKKHLSAGENIDTQNGFGDTALFRAARANRKEIVGFLLRQGAMANLSNRRGWTSLHTASVQGHIEIVRLLLHAGAYVDMRNKNGWTPLFLAAGSGYTEVVKCLLEAGANADAEDGQGVIPLDNAQKNGYQEIVKLLKDAMGLQY